MPLVLAEYPKAKLVILGKGEEQQDITELADLSGISKNVEYRPEFVSEEERIMHYAASDLCVFPSIYEPFGIVSLEAMSMEKPVVVGAKGVVGFREQVVPAGPGAKRGSCGWWEPSGHCVGTQRGTQRPIQSQAVGY